MPIANFPPNLTAVEVIEVAVERAFTLQLEAFDPDGDDISYELTEMINGASITAQGK